VKTSVEYRVVAIRECPLPEDLQLCDVPAKAAEYWQSHVKTDPTTTLPFTVGPTWRPFGPGAAISLAFRLMKGEQGPCNRMQHQKCATVRFCDIFLVLTQMRVSPLFIGVSRMFTLLSRKANMITLCTGTLVVRRSRFNWGPHRGSNPRLAVNLGLTSTCASG
jgi:hypothetical protein